MKCSCIHSIGGQAALHVLGVQSLPKRDRSQPFQNLVLQKRKPKPRAEKEHNQSHETDGGTLRMRMTIPWVSTLWSCEKNMNLGFKRPRFQSWLCHQVAARSPPTSTFSRSHVLWCPQGVNQVSCAASVDICFVSSGIFHGDVSLDRFMAGLGSVPWKHSSCDETRMSSCRLSINQQRHSHSHPNTIPPHNLPPLQPTLSPQPKDIQIISLESNIQQDSLLLIGRVARAHPYRHFHILC